MMVDHNVLKDDISSASRYMKLQDLKNTISGLKRKLPTSISLELEGRITEKLRAYDYPICSVAKIRVIFSNGLSKELEPEECIRAQARGISLSNYIFSHYVSARDFTIENIQTLGSTNFGYLSEEAGKRLVQVETLTPLTNSEIRERMDFLMKRVENLERIEMSFAENLPKIARDVNDLKDKVDRIYKIIENK